MKKINKIFNNYAVFLGQEPPPLVIVLRGIIPQFNF